MSRVDKQVFSSKKMTLAPNIFLSKNKGVINSQNLLTSRSRSSLPKETESQREVATGIQQAARYGHHFSRVAVSQNSVSQSLIQASPEEDQEDISYEDSMDYCNAHGDVPPDSPDIENYPKLIEKGGNLDSVYVSMPRKLYSAEKSLIQKLYRKKVNVDHIRITTSGSEVRHQVAGAYQIRMGNSDFYWYKIAKLQEMDCPGYKIVEESIPGEVKTDDNEVAAALIHEAFHIQQRERGINVTLKWLESLWQRRTEEGKNELYHFDASITESKKFLEHFQGLSFEGQAQVYENLYRDLSNGANIDRYEGIVRHVIQDHDSSWSDIVSSMR